MRVNKLSFLSSNNKSSTVISDFVFSNTKVVYERKESLKKNKN